MPPDLPSAEAVAARLCSAPFPRSRAPQVNVTRVGAYIRERAEEGEVQFDVISLKDNFYEKAHGLVGIHRDRRLECSRTLTLDLTRAQGV